MVFAALIIAADEDGRTIRLLANGLDRFELSMLVDNMSADHPDLRALRIVRDALDTEPSLRDDLIRKRCQDDRELQQIVRQLLRQAAEVDEDARDDGPIPGTEPPIDPLLGTMLGPFRVIERIGRGGTGVIYRAEREHADFRQTVAIKLIRQGFDFEEVQRRFLRERRILARLNHPNLARFIDGGVTDERRPWFALEHVRGESITQWCDRRRLGVRDRVRRFLDVCGAVQYAHEQLVVHRDLKPGNILVDDSGTVKLLDFGISRLLMDEDEAGLTLTMLGHGRQALTPEYAAPEQFSGEPEGVATDVYSLAVILYVLVAGALPYDIDRRDVAAAGSVVRDVPPAPLAQAIGRSGNSAEAAPTARRLAARNMSMRAYLAAVRGDLGRIISKALQKDPRFRYSTVDAFADDIRRWLGGIPVRATGQRFGYRMGKFLLRNRLAAILTSVAAIATIAGIVGTVVQSRQSRFEAERANAVQDYLVSLFENAAPSREATPRLDVEALLRNGIERAQTEFAGKPLLQASMLNVLGRVHVEMGLTDQAQALLEQALDLLERAGDTRSSLFIDVLYELARVQRDRQRYPQTEALLRRGLALLPASEPAQRVPFLRLLGVVIALNGDRERGLVELQKALALQRRLETPPGHRVAGLLGDIGYVLDVDGPVEESLPYYMESLDVGRRIYGVDHSDVATTLGNIGQNLHRRGKSAEARPYFEEALRIDEAVYTRPHTSVAASLGNLALVELESGNFQQAESLLRRALAIRESLFDPDDPRIAITASNLAVALTRQGHFVAAEDFARRAVDIYVAADGDWRFRLAFARQNLSRVLRESGQPVEAETQAREAVVLFTDIGSDRDANTLNARAALAMAIGANGRFGEAHAMLGQVLDDSLPVLDRSHPQLVQRFLELAQLDVQLGQDIAARERFQAVLDRGVEALGERHAHVVDARLGLAGTLMRLGEEAACLGQVEQLRRLASDNSFSEAQNRQLSSLVCAG